MNRHGPIRVALTLLPIVALAACGVAQSQSEDAGALLRRGTQALVQGDLQTALELLDRAAALSPANEPHLWQRGIAYYYAGRYGDCSAQFERHKTVNANDVENAVWHLMCAAQLRPLEAAQKEMLPVGPDSRAPMEEVEALFRGGGSVEAVLAAIEDQAGTRQERSAKFYGSLYLGIWYELIADREAAESHLEQAAAESAGVMGDIARLHLKRLRRGAWAPAIDRR